MSNEDFHEILESNTFIFSVKFLHNKSTTKLIENDREVFSVFDDFLLKVTLNFLNRERQSLLPLSPLSFHNSLKRTGRVNVKNMEKVERKGFRSKRQVDYLLRY